jgi:hypothetical protein
MESEQELLRSKLIEAFLKHPLEALVYPVTRLVVSDDSNARPSLQLIASMIGVRERISSAEARATLALIDLLDCDVEGIEDKIDIVLSNERAIRLARVVLRGDLMSVERRLFILNILIRKLRQTGIDNWRDFVLLTRRALDARKSGLTNSSVWNDQLAFPRESFDMLLPTVI